jgi:uncharacterized protein YndB with AHSA1/START domain
MKSTDIKNRTQITKDLKDKSILVSREFDAPVEKVWQAFTQSEILDKWWGPTPWRAETKIFNFSPGGYWLYAMVSPGNEKQWGRMDYLNIRQYESFELEDSFCDENGNISDEFPVSNGQIAFSGTENGTLVNFKMKYPNETDLEKMVELGFEEGISISLDQLESYLKSDTHF